MLLSPAKLHWCCGPLEVRAGKAAKISALRRPTTVAHLASEVPASGWVRQLPPIVGGSASTYCCKETSSSLELKRSLAHPRTSPPLLKGRKEHQTARLLTSPILIATRNTVQRAILYTRCTLRPSLYREGDGARRKLPGADACMTRPQAA